MAKVHGILLIIQAMENMYSISVMKDTHSLGIVCSGALNMVYLTPNYHSAKVRIYTLLFLKIPEELICKKKKQTIFLFSRVTFHKTYNSYMERKKSTEMKIRSLFANEIT